MATYKTYFLAFIAVIVLLVVPNVHLFAAGGLVPCNGPDCTFESLLLLAKNIIDFLILVSIPLTAIAFAYAGFLFLTAAGSEGQISKAKGIFTKVLIGFLFVLGAWLIVWTITTALLNPANYYNLLGGTRPSINP